MTFRAIQIYCAQHVMQKGLLTTTLNKFLIKRLPSHCSHHFHPHEGGVAKMDALDPGFKTPGVKTDSASWVIYRWV